MKEKTGKKQAKKSGRKEQLAAVATNQVTETSVGTALNKKHKLNLVFKMSQQQFLYADERRVSAGELKIDIINGGGWVRGRAHKIQGRFSSGKSSVLASTIAEFTRRHKERVLLIDYEGTWTTKWLLAKGADTDLVEYTRPYSAELAMDIFEAAVYSNEYSAVFLDSVASMSAIEEQEKSHGEATMNKLALITNRVCRELQSHMNEAYLNGKEVPTVFMTNQIRKSPDRFNPEFTPGGGQQDNLASTITEMNQRSKILENPNAKDAADEEKNYVGNYIYIRNVKNKIDPPFERCTVGILSKDYCGHPRHSFFHGDSIATVAIRLGLIVTSGAWYEAPNGKKYHGVKSLWEAVMIDGELRGLLVNSIKDFFLASKIDLQYSPDFIFPLQSAPAEQDLMSAEEPAVEADE